jgi:hypothetical protein
MKPQVKKVLIIVTTVIPALMIAGGGVTKIMGYPQVVRMLTTVGAGPYVPVLGIAEIVFAALFVIQKTRRLGFILLCCYFGGAIATVVSHQGDFFSPALPPLILIWINMLLRDPALFFIAKNEDHVALRPQ